MKLLRVYSGNVNSRFIDEAVEALRDGSVVIFPTGTHYALGCDALNNRAIERLCRVKGINPDKQPLAVVCSGLSMASEYARIDNEAYRILRRNLPGHFTFLLPAAPTLPKVFKGRRVVGIRVPESDIARALAEALGHPVMTTSIVPPEGEKEISADEISVLYASEAAVMLDGGGASPATGSTIVDLTDSREPEIVREGAGQLA